MSDNESMHFLCSNCDSTYSIDTRIVHCINCGSLVEIRQPQPQLNGRALSGTEIREHWDARLRQYAGKPHPYSSGVWRFIEAIYPELAHTNHSESEEIVTQLEGNTPLLYHRSVSDWAGVSDLRIKHEGHNPTGSFKDRGMTVAVTAAKLNGANGVICASTGNTSSSLASYAGTAGLKSTVLIPHGNISKGKLAQTVAYGASVEQVDGNFDECLRQAQKLSVKLNYQLVNSLNPFRLEGQKTIVYELLQQLNWDALDWIALPAGNLGNTAAFGKALRELHEWGVIEKLPRLLAVQAAGASPFAQSFEGGFTERFAVEPETIATAIRIGDPASYDRAVRSIRETNGYVTSVSDDEILATKKVIDESGIGCEPASAASVAGVKKLRSMGVIKSTERVVSVLTGHILKDLDMVQ